MGCVALVFSVFISPRSDSQAAIKLLSQPIIYLKAPSRRPDNRGTEARNASKDAAEIWEADADIRGHLTLIQHAATVLTPGKGCRGSSGAVSGISERSTPHSRPVRGRYHRHEKEQGWK